MEDFPKGQLLRNWFSLSSHLNMATPSEEQINREDIKTVNSTLSYNDLSKNLEALTMVEAPTLQEDAATSMYQGFLLFMSRRHPKRLPLFLEQLNQQTEMYFTPMDCKHFYNNYTSRVNITPEFLEWIGFNYGTFKECYKDFEQELTRMHIPFVSDLPRRMTNSYKPPPDKFIMSLPRMQYQSLLLQLNTPKAEQIRHLLLQVYFNFKNYQNHLLYINLKQQQQILDLQTKLIHQQAKPKTNTYIQNTGPVYDSEGLSEDSDTYSTTANCSPPSEYTAMRRSLRSLSTTITPTTRSKTAAARSPIPNNNRKPLNYNNKDIFKAPRKKAIPQVRKNPSIAKRRLTFA